MADLYLERLLTGVGGMTDNSQGLQGLMQRPQNLGIDFLAAARGQQMANDIAWQNRQRDIQAKRYADYEQRRDDLNQIYAENLRSHRLGVQLMNDINRMRADGMENLDILKKVYKDVSDGKYANESAAVQNNVRNTLDTLARNMANEYAKGNNFNAVRDIDALQGYRGANNLKIALESMPPMEAMQAILTHYGKKGTFGKDAYGNDTIQFEGGPAIPVAAAVKGVYDAGGRLSGLYNVINTYQADIVQQARAQNLLNRNKATNEVGATNTTNNTGDGNKTTGDTNQNQQPVVQSDAANPIIAYAETNLPLSAARERYNKEVRTYNKILKALEAGETPRDSYGNMITKETLEKMALDLTIRRRQIDAAVSRMAESGGTRYDVSGFSSTPSSGNYDDVHSSNVYGNTPYFDTGYAGQLIDSWGR